MLLQQKAPRNEIIVLQCNGNIDTQSMETFSYAIDEFATSNGNKIVLDLQKSRHADISGVGILVAQINKMRSVGGDIKICNIHNDVCNIFRLIGVNNVIDSYKSQKEAMSAFTATKKNSQKEAVLLT